MIDIACLKRSALVNSRDVTPCTVIVTIRRGTSAAVSQARNERSGVAVFFSLSLVY